MKIPDLSGYPEQLSKLIDVWDKENYLIYTIIGLVVLVLFLIIFWGKRMSQPSRKILNFVKLVQAKKRKLDRLKEEVSKMKTEIASLGQLVPKLNDQLYDMILNVKHKTMEQQYIGETKLTYKKNPLS